MVPTLLESWKQLVLKGYLTNFNKCMVFQTQIAGIWTEVDWSYTDLGFTPKRYDKLTNTYIIPASMQKFRDNMDSVKDGSVLMRFGNREKTGKNRDFCLVGLAVAKGNSRAIGIDVYLRSSEIVSQLLVDFLFLQTILRENGFDPVGINTRICITSGFTAKMFYPVFYKICKLKFGVDYNKQIPKGAAYLRKLDAGDIPSWRLAARASSAYLQLKDPEYMHNMKTVR